MRLIRIIAIAFLVAFNLYYGALGFNRLLFPNYLEREIEDNPIHALNKIEIFLCFLASFAGLLVVCTKHKAFRIFYLMLLLAAIGITCYKLTPATNNLRLHDELLDVIRNNRTDTFPAILLKFSEKTYRCCGVRGPEDYMLLPPTAETDELPKSCCPQPPGFVCEEDLPPCYLKDAHKSGCWNRIYESNRDANTAAFRLNLGVLIGQFLACLSTLTLCKLNDAYH